MQATIAIFILKVEDFPVSAPYCCNVLCQAEQFANVEQLLHNLLEFRFFPFRRLKGYTGRSRGECGKLISQQAFHSRDFYLYFSLKFEKRHMYPFGLNYMGNPVFLYDIKQNMIRAE